MPTTSTRRAVIHASVPTDLAKRARAVADAEDRSVSYLLRRGLEREIERIETANTTLESRTTTMRPTA